MKQLAYFFASAVLFIAGCDEDELDRVNIAPITGKVLVGSKPATGALVTLHPQEERLKGLSPRGQATADGSFQLSTYEQNDGAPAGTYLVTVVWPIENFQPVTPEQMEAVMHGEKPDRLRGRYASSASSNLTVTISEDQTELPPIELK